MWLDNEFRYLKMPFQGLRNDLQRMTRMRREQRQKFQQLIDKAGAYCCP